MFMILDNNIDLPFSKMPKDGPLPKLQLSIKH